MHTLQSTIEFSVGPRNILVVYDKGPRRLIVRAIIQDGTRITRTKRPELYKELRDDFLTALRCQ